MSFELAERMILFIDAIGVIGLLTYAWIDLQRQTSDLGRVGGVVAIAALCFVFYFIGRAFLGV
jgi:hypothetical protein